jgi:hypothetical protein
MTVDYDGSAELVRHDKDRRMVGTRGRGAENASSYDRHCYP